MYEVFDCRTGNTAGHALTKMQALDMVEKRGGAWDYEPSAPGYYVIADERAVMGHFTAHGPAQSCADMLNLGSDQHSYAVRYFDGQA